MVREYFCSERWIQCDVEGLGLDKVTAAEILYIALNQSMIRVYAAVLWFFIIRRRLLFRTFKDQGVVRHLQQSEVSGS